MNVFLDECGYTGEHLLDEEQPVFVVAALAASENECEAWKEQFFGQVRARELKHSVLARRPAGQDKILDFIRHVTTTPGRVSFGLAHKHYALVGKMVDHVLEPAMREDGLDLYRRGANIAFTNLLYWMLHVDGYATTCRPILDRFEYFARSRSELSYEAFWRALALPGLPKSIDDTLDYLRMACFRLGRDVVDLMPEHALDITVTMIMALMADLRRTTDEEMVLIHDESKPMARERHIWQALTNPDLPSKVVGYDRRRISYPVAIRQTIPGTSVDWRGLQLADLLAGAMTRATTWLTEGSDPADEYGREAAALLHPPRGGWMLWPSQDVTPEELGTTGPDADDPNEFVRQTLFGRATE